MKAIRFENRTELKKLLLELADKGFSWGLVLPLM